MAGNDRFFITTADLVLGLAAISILCLMIWGLNRGFDITDEGFYMLSSSFHKPLPGLSSFHLYSNMLPQLSANRVIDLRIWHLIYQLVSSSVLAVGFLRWFRNTYEGPYWLTLPTVLSIAALGNFFVIAVYPHALSYNSQSNFSILVSAGLMFLAESLRADRSRARLILNLLAGLVAGPCLLIKAPAFVAYLFAAVVFCLVIPKRNKLINLLAFFVGVAVSLGAYFLWVESYDALLARELPVFKMQTSGATVHSKIATIYLDHLRLVFDTFKAHLLPLLALSFLLPFLSFRFKGRFQPRSWSLLVSAQHVLVLGLLLWLCVEHKMLKQNFFSPEVFYFLALFLFCQWFGAELGSGRGLSFFRRFEFARSRVFLGLVFLGSLTFACTFGTSNPLLFHSQIHFAPWFILLAVLAYLLSVRMFSALPMMTVAIMVAACAASQLYDYYVKHPYSLYATMFEQTRPVERVANLKGLLVSPSAAKFFTDLDDTLTAGGFRPGDFVLGFYHMQGLVYAVGARSPGSPLYAPYPYQMDSNRVYLKEVRTISPKRLFLLLGWNVNQTMRKALKEEGYNFPDDFQLLGTVVTPLKQGELDGVPDSDYLKGKIQIYRYVGAKGSLDDRL